jgi:hypothetical protein
MKAGVCFLLILTQVLVGTLGQGALSLCVRTDGTQRVHWTFAKCANEKVADQKACSCCGAKKKLESDLSESPVTPVVKHKCHSCEDYVIVADYESISHAASHQLMDEFSKLSMNVAFELMSQFASGQIASKFDSSQVLLPDILSTVVSTVVIRC